MTDLTNQMRINAQIAFRNTGLELIKNPKVNPQDVYDKIQNIYDNGEYINEDDEPEYSDIDLQYISENLNHSDDIEKLLKTENRYDLLKIFGDMPADFGTTTYIDFRNLSDQKQREFVEFYLNHLIP